ncbi:NIPA-like protein 2, partial [Teratosphaeria destructans]
MYLPARDAAPTPTRDLMRVVVVVAGGTSTTSGAPPAGGWSSLIGIITAICGNILISFALNTQRYAHLRLSRDHDAQEQQSRQERRARRRQKGTYTYGALQREVAEERAEANAKRGAEGGGYTIEDSHSITDRASTSSDDTARPHHHHDGEDGDDDDDDEKDEGRPAEKSYLKSRSGGQFRWRTARAASIVSPLGVVALISNCLIAPLLLGETFRWRDALGVVIAVGGCVTVVLSASDSNPKLDQDKIWSLIAHWEFLTYFAITVFLILVLSLASNRLGEKTILIDLGLVGLYGGYTALSTKGISSLLSTTIWRVVTFPITYVLLAILIFTAVMQIKYVNRALQRFNATMVIPTQFVMFTISVIVGSAVLYRDFEREEAGDAVKFVGGCALTFLGVWCITSGRGDDDADADDDASVEEDAIDLRDEEHVQPEIRERDDADRPATGLRRFRTADSLPPSLIVTPAMHPESRSDEHPPLLELDRTPTKDSLQELPPANAAAIHSRSLTELRQDSPADPSQKPPLHATTSAPVLPHTDTSSFTLRPKTPLNRNPTTPLHDSPSKRPTSTTTTPSRASRPSQHHLDPNTALTRLSRNS